MADEAKPTEAEEMEARDRSQRTRPATQAMRDLFWQTRAAYRSDGQEGRDAATDLALDAVWEAQARLQPSAVRQAALEELPEKPPHWLGLHVGVPQAHWDKFRAQYGYRPTLPAPSAALAVVQYRAALERIAALIDTESGEPLDEAIEIATKALATPSQAAIPLRQERRLSLKNETANARRAEDRGIVM